MEMVSTHLVHFGDLRDDFARTGVLSTAPRTQAAWAVEVQRRPMFAVSCQKLGSSAQPHYHTIAIDFQSDK